MTSPVISDDPTPIDSDRPIELAPSEVASDEPSFARAVGMAAAAFALLGGAALLAHHLDGPKFVSKPMAAFLVVFGMLGMLFHSARDTEQEVRRTYAFLGYALVVLSGILAIVNKSIFPFGFLSLLGSWGFLSFFARNETDENWKRPVFLVLGGLGFAIVGLLLVGICFASHILPGSGIVLGIIALLFLCSLSGQFGSTTDSGRLVMVGVGGAGLLLIGFSVIRSLFFDNSPPFFIPGGLMMSILGVIYVIVAIGMLTDNSFVVMTRKELTGYFYSPIAYLVLIGMTLIGWLNFWEFVSDRLPRAPLEPIVQSFLIGWYAIIATICIVPAITMRLISEEKRTGTYEVLMSLPISEITVVLSKFVASLIFFVLLWVPWGLYLIALQSELDRPFDYRPLLSFYFALIFTGGGFVAMGLFFSSLTKNQIIAAVLTFTGMLALTFLFFLRNSELVGPLWRAVFEKLGYVRIWIESLGGRLPVHDLVLYASLTLFWLFLTVKSLESRKWN